MVHSIDYTAELDPAQFHCVRYLGPPISALDKNQIIYAFSWESSQDKVAFTAPLAFTWSESDAKLILPLWMRKYQQDSDTDKLSFHKIDSKNVVEYAEVLELHWVNNLEPVHPQSFPFEDIFPSIFEGKRPLTNGTILSFTFGGKRFLLQVKAQNVLDGELFWFNLEEGTFEFPVIHEKSSPSLQILLENGWKEEFESLTQQLQLKDSSDVGKKIYLLTGIPTVLQVDFINCLGRYKMLNLREHFPEEHFETVSDDEEDEELLDSSIDFIAFCETEKYSNELITSLLRKLRMKGHFINIFMSSSLTIESSSSLLHFDRTARRFNFEFHECNFKPASIAEKGEILLQEIGERLGVDDLKWILSSFSVTDLLRVGRAFRSTSSVSDGENDAVKRLFRAVDMIKTELGGPSSFSGIEDMKQTFPFYGYASLVKELKGLLSGPLLLREAYERFNLPMSSGYLLHGPAGCGKTSLCLNLLSETGSLLRNNFNIIHIPSAGQLLSKYFGETEANIRRLFVRARERKPCILFIDQIEALGRKRGNDSGDSSARYLSTLLNELDGISGNEGVTILACANDISMLDEALLRPGRLDRHFLLDFPSPADRLEIITGYGSEGFIEVADTEGLSGAEIKSLTMAHKRNM